MISRLIGDVATSYATRPALRVLTLIMLAVLLAGSLARLPITEDPALSQRFGLVTVEWPGTSPDRVDRQVIEVLERRLLGLEEVTETTATSALGIGIVAVELREDINTRTRTDNAWAKVLAEVDEISPDLPAGSRRPQLERVSPKAATLTFFVGWTHASPPDMHILSRVAQELQTRLAGIPQTEKVERRGAIDEQIWVEADGAALTESGISIAELARVVGEHDTKQPVGALLPGQSRFTIELEDQYLLLENIREIPVRRSERGETLRVGDVATVRKAAQDPPDTVVLHNGLRGIGVSAYSSLNARVSPWTQQVFDEVDDFQALLSDDVHITPLFVQDEYTSRRMESLVSNLVIAVLLVVLVLVFSLGVPAAIAVGASIPLVIAVVLWAYGFLGVWIHQMSVTGIIIALGILIDASIVTVDEYVHRRKLGITPINAVKDLTRLLTTPLLISTVTTACVFLPIATAPGPSGEFVGTMALSVTLSVIASFVLSLTLIPSLCMVLERWTGLVGGETQGSSLMRGLMPSAMVLHYYQRGLDWILAKRWRGPLLGCLLPVMGFGLSTTLDSEFFPPANRDHFEIRLTLPSTASIDATRDAVSKVRDVLAEHDDILFDFWYIGSNSDPVYYNAVSRSRGSTSKAIGSIWTTSPAATQRLVRALESQVQRAVPEAIALVQKFQQGPPVSAPIEVSLLGPDQSQLEVYAEQLQRVIGSHPAVTYAYSSSVTGQPSASVRPDIAELSASALTPSALARLLSSWVTGVAAGSLIDGDIELPIIVKADDQTRRSTDQLMRAAFAGTSVPQPSTVFSGINLSPQTSALRRVNGERSVEISAHLPDGVLALEVTTELQPELDRFAASLSPGYRILTEGAAGESADSQNKLLSNAAVFLVLMFAVTVLGLGTFREAGLVARVAFLSVGLGLFGVWLTGQPMGFIGTVGILGLIGIAVNDSIVVLSGLKNNPLAMAGDLVATRNVLVKSTRHVLSTSATTIAGFMPLILFGEPFWLTLSGAIAGGVAGATVIALTLVPSWFVAWRKRILAKEQRPSSKISSGAAAATAALALLAISPVAAQESEMTLDGQITESAWDDATRVDQFYQVQPLSDEPPQYKTTAFILSRKDGLWLSARVEQPLDKRTVRKHPRDGDFRSDIVFFVIDMDGNGVSGRQFMVSSSGSLKDAVIFNENERDTAWDGEWEAAVTSDVTAWYVEVHIPWHVLSYGAHEGEMRPIGYWIGRWVFADDRFYGSPNMLPWRGDRFLSQLAPAEINNFAGTSLHIEPSVSIGQDGVAALSDLNAASISVFWKPNSSNSIAASLLPDFGQAEADEVVVNFSSVESFFPEKRGLFLEGAEVFDVSGPDFRLLHTRRIGAAPDHDCSEAGLQRLGTDLTSNRQAQLDACEEADDDHLISEVDIAAKYVRSTARSSFGLLIADESNSPYSLGRSFGVARYTYKTSKLSVGGILTHAKRPVDGYSATTAAVDWNAEFDVAGLRWRGVAIGSDAEDGRGGGLWSEVSIQPSSSWNGSVFIRHLDNGLDLSDSGFLGYDNDQRIHAESHYRKDEFKEGSALRQLRVDSWVGIARLLNPSKTRPLYGGTQASFVFQSGGALETTAFFRTRGANPFILSSDYAPFINAGSSFGVNTSYRSSNQSKLRSRASIRVAAEPWLGSGVETQVRGELNWAVTSGLALRIAARYQHKPYWLISDGDANDLDTSGFDNHVRVLRRRQYTWQWSLNWIPSDKSELRAVFDVTTFRAYAPVGYLVDPSGNLSLETRDAFQAQPFDFVSGVFQLRYRRRLGPLSDLFVVGSFSLSESFEDDRRRSTFRQVGDFLVDPESALVLVKLRYRFQVL